MRLAIAISVWAVCFAMAMARADEPFSQVAVGSHGGYIVPERYASDHKDDLIASLPGQLKIDGFWTPSEQDVRVADRVFRELIQDAEKDPTLLFPDLEQSSDDPSADSLEHEQKELVLIGKNYEGYLRQYVGLVVEGKKLVFCNYSDVPKVDPATDYIFMQKFFVAGGKTHFLQSRVDPDLKVCSNVSFVGSWQPEAEH